MALERLFKSISKNLLIYIMITLVPSLIIGFFFAQNEVKKVERDYKNQAQENANFHASNIENFLSQTVGSLEMLATSMKIQYNNLINVEHILEETKGKDPRFSGFYWSMTNGDIIVNTNKTTSPINISDRLYFQQALKTGKTSISDAHIGRVTGRYVITIATPIVDHGQVEGVLCASIRLDEIEKEINHLAKHEMIIVTDQSGHAVIKAGSIVPVESTVNSSMNITQIPWTITSYVNPNDNYVFQHDFLKDLIGLFTIANILFLLTKYLLLRKSVMKETEQTEIQKLELIGNLAASTAHEIRNPLTGIKGLIKLLSEEYHDQKAQYYFKVIQQEIDRINAIVSELLVLGKPTATTLETYNANNIIAEIEPIIQSETNYMNIRLSIDYSTNALPISCVKDQLKQVILNLAKNSLQAMPHGGHLAISLERQSDSCVIKVVDNGVGMEKDQLNQAFNPFYTLKKDGSGLGLTVCKRIIDTFNGEIIIESAPEQGTQVKIILPLLLEQNSDS